MIVNLTDYVPTPRYDSTPWTHARIEEAPTKDGDTDGDWTVLETVPLDPLDADPTNPRPRSFTVETASDEGQWYRIVFLDTPGEDEQATEPLQNVTRLTSDYRPSPGDVASLLYERCSDVNGQNWGVFTTATTPTGDQVDALIDRAMGHLSQRLGDEPPAALWQAAREVVVLRTAMLVELSYFPSQITADRSPYKEFKELYDQALVDLLDARLRLGSDDEAGTDDDTSAAGMPSFSFGREQCHTPGAETPLPPWSPYGYGGCFW